MNKKITFGLVLILLVLAGAKLLSPRNPPPPDKVAETEDRPIVYYGETCPHCHKVLEYLEKKGQKDAVSLKEIYKNKDNHRDLSQKAAECGLDTRRVGVPFMYHKGSCLMGDGPIIDRLEELLQ